MINVIFRVMIDVDAIGQNPEAPGDPMTDPIMNQRLADTSHMIINLIRLSVAERGRYNLTVMMAI